MSESGKRLVQGAKEAAAVASGSIPAHSMTINGHTYYSEPAIASWGLIELMVRNPELSERVSDLEARLEKAEAERDAARKVTIIQTDAFEKAKHGFRNEALELAAKEVSGLRPLLGNGWTPAVANVLKRSAEAIRSLKSPS